MHYFYGGYKIYFGFTLYYHIRLFYFSKTDGNVYITLEIDNAIKDGKDH